MGRFSFSSVLQGQITHLIRKVGGFARQSHKLQISDALPNCQHVLASINHTRKGNAVRLILVCFNRPLA